MPLLRAPGGHIHYDVQGEGEPIVIINGMCFSARHWLGFDGEMARHFRVITIDNRGVGYTTLRATWNLTISDMASDVIRVLDHLNIERAHIMGVSMGGMIALALGLHHAGRCRTLVVINSSIAGTRTMRLTVPAVWRMVRAGRDTHRIAHSLSDLLSHKAACGRRRQAVARSRKAISDREGWPFVTTWKHLLAAMRFDIRHMLNDMPCPTMILYGAGDQFVPPTNSHVLHQAIPHAELRKIHNAGHEISNDQPEELLRAILSFTASPRQRTA